MKWLQFLAQKRTSGSDWERNSIIKYLVDGRRIHYYIINNDVGHNIK